MEIFIIKGDSSHLCCFLPNAVSNDFSKVLDLLQIQSLLWSHYSCDSNGVRSITEVNVIVDIIIIINPSPGGFRSVLTFTRRLIFQSRVDFLPVS